MTWQRTAHNPEVAGSNPAPATQKGPGNRAFFRFLNGIAGGDFWFILPSESWLGTIDPRGHVGLVPSARRPKGQHLNRAISRAAVILSATTGSSASLTSWSTGVGEQRGALCHLERSPFVPAVVHCPTPESRHRASRPSCSMSRSRASWASAQAIRLSGAESSIPCRRSGRAAAITTNTEAELADLLQRSGEVGELLFTEFGHHPDSALLRAVLPTSAFVEVAAMGTTPTESQVRAAGLGGNDRLLLGNLAAFGLVSFRGGSLALGVVLLVGAGFGHSPVSFLGSLAVALGSFLR